MRVLFVHYGDDWIAGSEIALLELIKALRRLGVEPFLWCNAPAMTNAAAELGAPSERDDFQYYFDYSSPRFSPRRFLALARKAGRLIEARKIDVVHCNGAAPTQWMAPACLRRGAPLLTYLHSPYLRRSRFVTGLHLADGLVAVSKAVAAPLIADGVEPSRVAVVPNGFDRDAVLAGDRSTLRAELGIPADAVVGAIVGSLIRRKGHDILLAAMARRTFSRPFHLLVVGDGPENDALQNAARGLPVHFLGRSDGVGAILRDAADFLVLPSRQEAFGRVIVEAALAGKPAIGANVDGVPEAIVDGVSGILVPPESPDALGAAMERLIGDEGLRRRLGAAAEARAAKEFSIDACAEAMLACYAAAVARAKQPRSFRRRLKPYLNLVGFGRRGALK
ncbi:MAG TPA: glycosyltransferase family 4 protein [Rhizomicrobium sp.]|jgi:glycosyltransferase involved in cell wall biosynthesis|nr:glycosyltransferase family 4 protein [Rhizomicrobium sp.]